MSENKTEKPTKKKLENLSQNGICLKIDLLSAILNHILSFIVIFTISYLIWVKNKMLLQYYVYVDSYWVISKIIILFLFVGLSYILIFIILNVFLKRHQQIKKIKLKFFNNILANIKFNTLVINVALYFYLLIILTFFLLIWLKFLFLNYSKINILVLCFMFFLIINTILILLVYFIYKKNKYKQKSLMTIFELKTETKDLQMKPEVKAKFKEYQFEISELIKTNNILVSNVNKWQLKKIKKDYL